MIEPTVPEVQDPERFFPEPRVVREPWVRGSREAGYELYRHDKEAWVPVHPLVVDLARSLAGGATFQQAVDGLPDYPAEGVTHPRLKAKVARRHLWNLARAGYLTFDLEPPPDRFHDRYAHVRELGRGGLGVVHLCRDTAHGDRPVVVKHPWGVKRPIETGQRTLAREHQALALLDHPAVPELVDAFTDRGLLHVVRGYVEGESLQSLRGRGLPDPVDRPDAVAQVAAVLAHAHERGLVVLDVSPDNFLMDDEDRLHLIDLGSAVLLDHGRDRAELGGRRGTPGYAPPECRRGRPSGHHWAGPGSDVFGLGRLHAFLATGERPSRAWGNEQLGTALAAAGTDQDEVELVLACCREDPAERLTLSALLDGLSGLGWKGPRPGTGRTAGTGR